MTSGTPISRALDIPISSARISKMDDHVTRIPSQMDDPDRLRGFQHGFSRSFALRTSDLPNPETPMESSLSGLFPRS
jgi:hypothetical protein